MANRLTPTSATPPPLAGGTMVDIYASHFNFLFNNMSLIPTVVVNSGNDYTLTVDPVLNADVVAGMRFVMRPNVTATGAVRLRIGANPYYDVVKTDGTAIDGSLGEWDAANVYEIVFFNGDFVVIGSSGAGGAGAVFDYQEFPSSGTWTKPPDASADGIAIVEIWGAGGGGSTAGSGSGGGGGAYNSFTFRLSDLPSSVVVSVAAGGLPNAFGGTTTFDIFLSAFGGATGGSNAAGGGGGGGGITSSGGNNGGTSTGGNGGGPAILPSINYGGKGGSSGGAGVGEPAIWGGGGGGCNGNPGGASIWGGAGGSGGATSQFASSIFGGNGGADGVAGSVRGGGGGQGATGGNGFARVKVIG